MRVPSDRSWRPDAAPPDELPAPPVRLQRFRLADLAELEAEIRRSRAHLAPWQDWARTADLTSLRAFLFFCEAAWDARTDFQFAIREADGRLVGGSGLHARLGPGTLEIGYWVAEDRVNRGYATAAARALTAAARQVGGVSRIEIRCDEANVRSAAVPRKLGYRLDTTIDEAPEAPAESGRSSIWVLDYASGS